MFFVFHTRRFVCKGVPADRTFAFFIDDASADVTFFHKILLLCLYETIIAYIFV